MLFQDHLTRYDIEEGEVIYYNGAFVVNMKERIIGTITGIKQKDEKIRTYVEYHKPDGSVELKIRIILDPVDLEKLIYDIHQKSKVTEIIYRTRTLDDAFSEHLDDQEKELIHQRFLLRMMNGQTRSDAYEDTINFIKRTVAQRI